MKREADGKDPVVVVAVELSRCDLEAAADRHANSFRQHESSGHNSRSDIVQRLSGVLSILIVRGVEFDLRPELLHHAVLQGVIPEVVPPIDKFVGRGILDTEGSLDIEVAVALAIRNGRRNRRRIGPRHLAVRIGSGGDAPAQKRRQDVIPVLFVSGEDAVLDQECNIARPVRFARVAAVVVIRRSLDDQLCLVPGDQLQALCSVVFVPRVSIDMLQPVLVVTKFFFEARCRGRNRCHPVRLFALGLVHPIKPVREISILPERQRRTGERNRREEENRGPKNRLRFVRISSNTKMLETLH